MLSEIRETVVHCCSLKKMFLKISQTLQENAYVQKYYNLCYVRVSFLIKLQAWSRGSEFSSYETGLRKMTSRFELLPRNFL